MDIGKIPSDNYYKFVTFIGLILTFAGFVPFYFAYVFVIPTLHKINIDLALTKVEVKQLEDKYISFDKEYEMLKEKLLKTNNNPNSMQSILKNLEVKESEIKSISIELDRKIAVQDATSDNLVFMSNDYKVLKSWSIVMSIVGVVYFTFGSLFWLLYQLKLDKKTFKK
jgi:hypothetical protein